MKIINNLKESMEILKEYDRNYIGSNRHITDVNLLQRLEKEKNGKVENGSKKPKFK